MNDEDVVHPGFVNDEDFVHPGFVNDGDVVHPGFVNEGDIVVPGFVNDGDVVVPDKKAPVFIPGLYFIHFEEGFSYFINIILRVSTLPSVERR